MSEDMQEGTGFLLFAWVLLLCAGVLNIIEGILMVGRASVWTDPNGLLAGHRIVFSDLATWGWVILIWGIVQLLGAGSIAKGEQFGRWLGMLIAGVAMIIQFTFLPAYPFWGLILIGIYMSVFYGLAAYGGTHKQIGD